MWYIMGSNLKPVRWIGSSYRDLKGLPSKVRRVMGFALDQAQRGGRSLDAKPMKGFGGAGVLEVVDDYDGRTFRAVYVVRYTGVVYVIPLVVMRKK